jgi:predicted GNAT family acetyltransferase
MEIKHDKENNRFTMDIHGEDAKVDYRFRDGKMHLVYSEVPFEMRGQGYGKKLVEGTFEKLTGEGHEAVAVCSYIRAVARRSEKWRSIIG